MKPAKTKQGQKYLTVEQAELLQGHIEYLAYKEFGLDIKTRYHPTFIEVPIQEEL